MAFSAHTHLLFENKHFSAKSIFIEKETGKVISQKKKKKKHMHTSDLFDLILYIQVNIFQ